VEARRKDGAEYPPKNFIVVSKVHLFWRIKFLNLKFVIFNFRVKISVEQNELHIVWIRVITKVPNTKWSNRRSRIVL
jgi:hypothetical protein